MSDWLPQIVIEAPAPTGCVSEVDETVRQHIAVYYESPKPRAKDIWLVEATLAAVADYHATDFHPCAIQNLRRLAKFVGAI